MIINSSNTAGYNQILKQMTYGGKKLKKKRKILKMEKRDMEEREKKKKEVEGRYTNGYLDFL